MAQCHHDVAIRRHRVRPTGFPVINPRHLRPFLAVARTGSVAAAAEQIHRVPSAVTRSVQELEADLRVQLFERRAHGMLLTDGGRVLLVRVEALFAELDAARQFMVGSGRGAAGCNPNAPIFSLSIGLQRLRVFVALVALCHMGAVARQFGMSPSAVSLALRDVEQGLGVELLARRPTGLVPNAMGERLALHLRRALSEMTKAEEEIDSRLQGITGRVVVGTLSLGRNWLPQAIIHTTSAHPRISVATVEADFAHLATLLRAAELDFIVGGLRPREELGDLQTQPLMRAGIALVARRGHPLTGPLCRGGWAALAAVRWVLPQPGSWTRRSLEASLNDRGLGPPTVAVETADVGITRALLLDSDLVTAVSPHLYRDEIDAGQLAVLPLKPRSEPRDIGIVTRADARPTVAAQLLMNAVAEAVMAPPVAASPHPPGGSAVGPAEPDPRLPLGR